MINFFLFASEGYHEALELFLQETGLQLHIPVDSNMANRVKILEAVQQGRIVEAIAMVEEFYPELLAKNQSLHLQLQVCSFFLFLD